MVRLKFLIGLFAFPERYQGAAWRWDTGVNSWRDVVSVKTHPGYLGCIYVLVGFKGVGDEKPKWMASTRGDMDLFRLKQ